MLGRDDSLSSSNNPSIQWSLGTPVPSNPSEEDVLAALLTGIEHSAQVQPLLVLIDDLHWSDAESLAILAYYTRIPYTVV
jgi:predicted ATPase